ncbi:MAG: formylglycine-generating enzyme family protein [Kiritimatiellia bacterium]
MSKGLARELLFLLLALGSACPVSAQGVLGAARAASSESGAPGVAGLYVYEPLPPAAYAPPVLARVPGGSFAMGNCYSNLSPNEGWASEIPVHEVLVSDFFIGRFEFTNEELARTLQWALTNGLVELGQTIVTNVSEGATNVVTNLYGTVRNTEGTAQELVNLDAAYCQIAFTNGSFGVAAGQTNFPAIYVTWHGALAVCNYLSDRQGLDRAVDFAPADWTVDISASGYRLPTEAEWEKACRGGNPGTHFPWPDDSAQGTNIYAYSIDPVKANYSDIRYSMAGTNHPAHPWYSEAVRTTPVGYYDGAQVVTPLSTNVLYCGADYGETNDMANGYGLYDMAGNVYEWCHDYQGTYWYTNAAAIGPDPTGPAAEESYFTQRVARGGGWTTYFITEAPDPSFQRCSFRNASYPAAYADSQLGFRVARRKLVVNAVAHAADEVSLSYWGESGKVYSVEGTTNLAATNEWPVLAETTNATTGESQIPVDAGPGFRALRIKAKWAP